MADMSVAWQRIRIPPVERVVLADLADRKGVSDEAFLVEMIHRAALTEMQSTELNESPTAPLAASG